MIKLTQLSERGEKILFWLPRILLIIFILFISIFALDVFEEYSGFDLLIALFMHLVPSFILIIILVSAWKYELVGAILFLITAVFSFFFFKAYEEILSVLFLILPQIIIGLLFFWNWEIHKKD